MANLAAFLRISLTTFSLCLLCGATALLSAGQGEEKIRYTPKGEMVFPEGYREWIWLSSGFGMSYGPLAASQQNANPPFDNVFVSPEAYRAFVATGKWPDGTVFILEIRSSQSQGSINRNGHFQGELSAIEAHVKDKGEWAFYRFGKGGIPGHLIAKPASCYSCHEDHGAVDTTFTQFYPTLFPIAQEKKVIKPGWTMEQK